jgi:23S rRNA (uracil1939-C5)-methyltransferase
MRYSIGDRLELIISGMNHEGQGVGRVDGYVVFINGAITGETVVAELIDIHRDYSTARLLHIISPSPDRIEPFCKVFGKCGG